MKTTLLALLALAIPGISSLSGIANGTHSNDELQSANSVDRATPIAAIQELAPIAPPSVQDPPPPPTEESPSDMPMEQSAVVEWDSSQAALSEGAMCYSCCHEVCCCEVATTLCLVDPCDGCRYEACVHLPPCCVGAAPVVEWKNGILGRKTICLCWPCCDKKAKVVVPVFGDLRVWE